MTYEYDAEKLEEEDDGDDGIQVGIETFICLCHRQHLRAVHLLSASPGKGHQGRVLDFSDASLRLIVGPIIVIIVK